MPNAPYTIARSVLGLSAWPVRALSSTAAAMGPRWAVSSGGVARPSKWGSKKADNASMAARAWMWSAERPRVRRSVQSMV